MKNSMKYFGIVFFWSLIVPFVSFSQDYNEAIEPSIDNDEAINLLKGGTLDAWRVPSDRWKIENETLFGNTGEEELDLPEWLYTKVQFVDFVFQCELKLTGDNNRNTGIYYRVRTFPFRGYKWFEAPSGYEFDAAFHKPGEENLWGSLGDWYARPALRIYPDPEIIGKAYEAEQWNRVTIRARGNRLEYWINGLKILDYLDTDPNASQKGIIGFQLHDGSVMEVQYRNIYVLPIGPQN